MARILFLTELLPYPLVAGPKSRANYVLRHLAARHQVTLLLFARVDDRPEDVAHLETCLAGVHVVPMKCSWLRNVRAVLAGLFTGQSAIIHPEEIRAMQQTVETLLATGEFDLVHIDRITMAHYGFLGRVAKVKRLLDQHNTTFRILERMAHDEGNWPMRRLLEQLKAGLRQSSLLWVLHAS